MFWQVSNIHFDLCMEKRKTGVPLPVLQFLSRQLEGATVAAGRFGFPDKFVEGFGWTF